MKFLDTADLPIKEPRPGWKGRFFNSLNMTFAYYSVEAGSTIHEHSHSNEEVWHILDGELEVTIEGDSTIAKTGSVALVPPDTKHSVRVLTDANVIVVDHPLRPSIGDVEV